MVAHFRSSDTFIAITVAFAIFTDTFLYDLILPFAPQIIKDRIGLHGDEVQRWTSILLSTYSGAFLIGNVAAGFATDLCSSKKLPFLFGLIAMIIATVMFFLAERVEVMLTARVLQGFAGAIVWVSGRALMVLLIDESRLGWAMGLNQIGTVTGELLGPVVGGVTYQHAGLMSVLGLALALLGVDIVLRILMAEKRQEQSQDEEEVNSPLLKSDQIQHHTEQGSATSSIDRAGSVEERSDDGRTESSEGSEIMQQKSSIRSSRTFMFWIIIVGTMLTSMTRYCFESTLPLHVSKQFGWHVDASGGIMFALLGPSIIAPIAGQYVVKYGPRRFSIIGFGANAMVMVGLGLVSGDSIGARVTFVVLLVLAGLCLTFQLMAQGVIIGLLAKRGDQEGNKKSAGRTLSAYGTAWSLSMVLAPLGADAVLETLNWPILCFISAAILSSGGALMFFTRDDFASLQPAGKDGKPVSDQQ